MKQCLAIVALVVALTPHTAAAQVLTTGETLGTGRSAILLSDNVIVPGDGVPSLNMAYVLWARGLHPRFDLNLSVGETTTDGASQAWIGGGGNVHLFKAGRVAVSAFTIATVPFNRRDEACDVLLNSAIVASVPVGGRVFVYSGINGLIPVGHRERAVFTPPDTKVNVPVGATYAFGKWGLWGEVDIGPLYAVGIGVSRLF